MSALARTDTSLVGRWWWTVDRWTLAALASIIAVGAMLTLAASPPVAERLGFDGFVFRAIAAAVFSGIHAEGEAKRFENRTPPGRA